jgi:hypothetical protein
MLDNPRLVAIGLISATLLMIELALTRIFSVVMYYHFAFLAISIALFGLSAAGVYAYVRRSALARQPTDALLASRSLVYAASTAVALFALVRLHVGLNYSLRNLALMLVIYLVAALPFFAGGLVLTIAITRFHARINAVYAADLIGAAGGCLLLLPLLDRLGAPGVVLVASAMASAAGVLFADPRKKVEWMAGGVMVVALPVLGQTTGLASFDVIDTKGHQGDRVLFSKWNSFSRVAVYERTHGDWSLSSAYTGSLPETRFMDIDSAASTPILHVSPDLSNAQYLRYELTALPYQLMESTGRGRLGTPAESDPDGVSTGSDPANRDGFSALIIGPGGGRDLVSALVFGAGHVTGVEINPIIAGDVMSDRFREFSGNIYHNPRVLTVIDDGRSYLTRTEDRFDVIQASLVDTWAATGAGAYTLTENTLYTVEAFNAYLDHLVDNGVLSITRWVFDGLRLVSLAQAACDARGWDLRSRLMIVQQDQVATFLLKRTPFTTDEISAIHEKARQLRFTVLYAPDTTNADNDYARLVNSPDRNAFYRSYAEDITPTTDDRPFFFHTTKLANQFQVAFGRSMLFGNGLSALLTLLGISTALVMLFIIGPLAVGRADLPRGWLAVIAYFGALGAGFMLIEVSTLQRFVLLLGHPVYSLTVTLFSLLLGTGLGAWTSRKVEASGLVRVTSLALLAIAIIGVSAALVLPRFIIWAIPFARVWRIAAAVAVLVPIGLVLGLPMPAGIRLLGARAPQMISWAWGMNGALSVVGATLAIFLAMNWGFSVTLFVASATYLIALAALHVADRYLAIGFTLR